jgi:hypothetical protein
LLSGVHVLKEIVQNVFSNRRGIASAPNYSKAQVAQVIFLVIATAQQTPLRFQICWAIEVGVLSREQGDLSSY